MHVPVTKIPMQRRSCPIPNIFLTCATSWFNLITLLIAFIFTMNSFLPFCYFTSKYSLFKCKWPLSITEIQGYLYGSPECRQHNILCSQQTKCNSASLYVYWCQIFSSNIPGLSASILSDFLKICTALFQQFITIIWNNLVHVSDRISVLSYWTLICLEILSCFKLIKLSIISNNLNEFNDSPTCPVGNN